MPDPDSEAPKSTEAEGEETPAAAPDSSPAEQSSNHPPESASTSSNTQQQQQQQQAPSAAQLSSAFSSPKQPSINRKEAAATATGPTVAIPVPTGATSSATNSPKPSPRPFRRVLSDVPNYSGTSSAVPPPKPRRSISHVNTSDDGSASQTPVASPSNVSISSRNTVKTGSRDQGNSIFTNNLLKAQQQQTNNNSSSSRKGGGGASPKMSPMMSSIQRKIPAKSSSFNSARNSQQQPPGGGQQQQSTQTPPATIMSKLDHPPLPLPRKASKCPLFSCFYAEFDNVVGPKICFQSPLGFMDQDTDVSLKSIHKLLSANFDRILAAEEHKMKKQRQPQKPEEEENEKAEDDRTTSSPVVVSVDKLGTSPTSPQSMASSNHSPHQPPTIKGSKSGDSVTTHAATNTTSSMVTTDKEQAQAQDDGSNKDETSRSAAPQTAPPASSSSTMLKDNNSAHSTKETTTAAAAATTTASNAPRDSAGSSSGGASGGGTSIFDSTSDFIITGNELTGNIVNLSAFNMHLLTRPTTIHDKRYERNSLLFCVGFVLRRSEDPRPFRPLLSKLALTLKRMEMESHFLSVQQSREQIQPLLDRILVSLNCTHWETNLVVNSNVLNLKLFHPPRYPASPIPDHAVPVMLRRDWQVQLYDWDLAINWVVLHIDGVSNARQISRKAEVDMEMVRNCLRVLKHHAVISLVDMFFYSNRYEPTNRAAAMLAGHESSLLQEAAEYVMKRPSISTIQTTAPPPYSNLMAPISPPTASPTATLQENFVKPPAMSGSPSSPLVSSYPPGLNENMVTASSLLGSSFKYGPMASYQTHEPHLFGALRREEQRELKAALAELYCVCNRNMSFGDIWIALASGKVRSRSFDRSPGERNKSGNKNSLEGRVQLKDQVKVTSNMARSFSGTRGDSTDDISDSEESRDNVDPVDKSPREYYFERLTKKSSCATIVWRNIFDIFDHRRFVSFGLVNGLLERVHNYPCILEASASITHQRDNSFTPSEAFLRRQGSLDQEPDRLARNAAAMMDGAHCDDDIVSTFQKPINDLVDLVEKYEGKKVLPIYSVAMEPSQ